MPTDYYAILGIAPSSDRDAVEEALSRCQPRWSAGARNPKHRHTYQSYLDQIPELRRTLLGDPAARASYDAEHAASRRIEHDRRLDELIRLVRLRAAKGGLSVADRDRLRLEADRLEIDREELGRLLEPIPPLPSPPPDPSEPEDPPVDAIDPATRGQIRRTLDHLGRRDLYDALDLPRDAPQTEIVDKAEADRRRWRQKSRVTAEMTAWLEAIAYAQSHLGTPQERARYDRTLELQAEERFNESARFCLEGERRLADSARRTLTDEAAALGIGPERSEILIRRVCRAIGVVPEGAPGPPDDARPVGPLRLLRCRSCRGVTEFRDAERRGKACRHCGDALRWECPICHRHRWVDEGRCSCGFRLELREPMLRHFEAARGAHRARDYASALAHLHRIQEFAPDHPGTRKAVEKVKNRLAAIERARAEVEQQLARRHLLAAQQAVRKWAALVDPTAPEVRSAFAEVDRGLREARSLAARGVAALPVDPNEARALLRRALEWSADLPEASEALRRCPPDPPNGLRAEVEGLAVRLRWSPPSPDGFGPSTFRVVRKRDAVPASPNDGVLVAETDTTDCLDAAVAPGDVVGYAVFSQRDGVGSISRAEVGPVLVLADVLDVRVEGRRGAVDLSWRLPAGADGVRVVRKIGAPPDGPDDGIAIESLPDGAADRDVEDDRVYHYAVFAYYRASDGRPRFARGVRLATIPQAPANAIETIQAALMPDGRVRVSWIEPEIGRVRILRTDRPLNVVEGQRLRASEVDALPGDWLALSGPGRAIDPKPSIGSAPRHYIPFTEAAGAVVVGRMLVFSQLPDPTDLRAVRVGGGGRVHLRWRWAMPGNRSLILVKSGGRISGPDDPEAFRQIVTEAQYSERGFAALDLPEVGAGPTEIVVFGMAERDGTVFHSPGLEPSARARIPGPLAEIAVSYTIRRPRIPGRPWSILLRTEPPRAPLPPLVLVGHPRTVPLNAEDGEVLEHLPSCRGGDQFRIRPKRSAPEVRLRLFLDPSTPPDQLSPVRLKHPEVESARL